MNIREFVDFLKQYPADMEVRLLANSIGGGDRKVICFDESNTLVTSDTAHINDDATVDEWDTEDGKRELGTCTPYLLLNPVIM